jgi:SulP family sulfate permease
MANGSASGRPEAPGIGINVVSSLLAGSLAALVTLTDALSYGALIFSGPELAPYLAVGLRTTLTAAWVLVLISALGSSFRFGIAGPNSNAVAILALMAGAVGSRLAAESAGSGEVVSTVLMLLAGSALGVGLIVFVIGALRYGHLVRFIPYPLAAGFLAGTGFLILIGGLRVLTGETGGIGALAAMSGLPAVSLLTVAIVALVPLALRRYKRNHIVMPAVIVAGTSIFYTGIWWGGGTLATARSSGLTFDIASARALPALPVFASVRWDLLVPEWEHLLAMALVVVIAILLNATGLELATQHDVDFDRELRVNGIGNVLSGMLGGTVGYLSIARSLLNYKAGALSRLAGIFSAVLCIIASVFLLPAMALVPRPVLAGLLIFSGLSLLVECVVETFFRLPLSEYGLILAILLLIIFQGLVTGVAFGLVVASGFFVYSYAKTGCIKHSFSVGTHFSNRDRALPDIALLRQKGTVVKALVLQGYLFFGTASVVVETCRKLLSANDLRFLLLDFRLVQGLDSSAVWSFQKLEQLCEKAGVALLFSDLRPELRKTLEVTRFLPRPGLPTFRDLDHGFEWLEDRLLEEAGQTGQRSMEDVLSEHFESGEARTLTERCETVILGTDEALFRRGGPGGALYFIERGSVSVFIHIGQEQTKRLRSCGPGTVVGEMAIYLRQTRSADVIADCPSQVRKLSAEALAQLEAEHPEVAHRFHRFVVKLLSSRLMGANDEIRSLL